MSGKTKKDSSRTYFELSQEKKKRLLGLFIISFSVLLFLSILSFSAADDPQVRNASVKALPTKNWLGIAGAYIALFFVKSAFGYFSLVIPVIMGMWGFVLFKKFDIKRLIYITNFLLSSAFILASFWGTIYHLGGIEEGTSTIFAGGLGKTMGGLAYQFLGGIGSVTLFVVLMVTVLVITFDLKIEKFFVFLADKGKEAFDSGVNKVKDSSEKAAAKREERKTSLEKSQDKISKVIRGDKSEKPPILAEELEFEQIVPDPPVQPAKPKPVFTTSVKTNPDIVPPPPKVDRAIPEARFSTDDYSIPDGDFLIKADDSGHYAEEAELESKKIRLKEKLALFDIEIEKIDTTAGPVVTLFEIVPAPGVKISKILSLENDIALALAAKGIRIIAPMPGRGTIGVEIPNDNPSIVLAGSVLPDLKNSKCSLPIALGKSISGQTFVDDLARVPHLLIAGATGSGKSVGVNMIISSLLFSKYPSEVKFAIIDPKKVELSVYETLKYHFLVKSPDLSEYIVSSPQSAVILLKSVVLEMELRYDKLSNLGVRNIVDYNNKIKTGTMKPRDEGNLVHRFMPYIVVVIDELADLMITAGKDVEEPIARLAQMARAVGIHLVVATQRPSVDVITGVIKANFPARIAYQTAQRTDSRTILDMNGAEQLLGRGDMLYLPPGTPKPIRIQNAYITTDEIEKLIEVVAEQPYPDEIYELPSLLDKKGNDTNALDDLDPLFTEAAQSVVRSQQGSVSFLQRKLKVGYARAARIVDQLEAAGIVGAGDGSKAREILVESDDELETILRNL